MFVERMTILHAQDCLLALDERMDHTIDANG